MGTVVSTAHWLDAPTITLSAYSSHMKTKPKVAIIPRKTRAETFAERRAAWEARFRPQKSHAQAQKSLDNPRPRLA